MQSLTKQTPKRNEHRDVAQLVAHYVRDVGVGRSSRLIPTEDIKSQTTNGVLIFLYRDQGARAPCAANEGQAKWGSVRVAPLPLRGDGRGRNAVGVGRSSRLIPTEDIKSQTTNGVLIFLYRDQGARAPCAANEGQAKWDSFSFLH